MAFDNKDKIEEMTVQAEKEIAEETAALEYNASPEGGETDSRLAPKRSLGESLKDYFASRRFKHGGLATIITVFFIIAVIVFNVVAVILVDRIPALSPDITKRNMYTLSDTSKELLDNLKEDVTIDILASEYDCKNPTTVEDPYNTISQALELIKRYGQYSDRVKINYVDLDVTPGYKNQYPEFADLIKQYSIVVSSARRSQITSFYEMLPYLGTDYDSTDSLIYSYVETELCSKIKSVCLDYVPVVSFLQCTGSDDPSGLQIQLASNGYEVRLVDFASEPIPEDTDIAILSALAYDLTDTQVNALSDFIYNDEKLSKNLFVLFAPDMPITPKLDAFLEEWGLQVSRDVIYETDSTRYVSADTPSSFFADYLEEDYAGDLESRGLIFANSASLEVKKLFDTKGNYTVTPLVGSTSAGTVWPNNIPYDVLKVDFSKNRVHYIMAQSEFAFKSADGEKLSSRVFVSGSVLNCSSSFLGTDALGNGQYFTSIFNKIAGISDQEVDITPKYISTIDYTIDARSANIITSIFQYIIPAILLVIGMVIYLRRRHL
ncbi:MAG: GldG family protein [Clostridia bacterium]|nr:GldG family protein [Clostridia bacterium]